MLVRVLLADDNALTRTGLRSIVNGLGRAIETVEAASMAEVEAALEAGPEPELAVIGLGLPGLEGLGGLDRLHQNRPAMKLAAISAQPSRAEAIGAFAAGASAYLPESVPTPLLQNLLRLVLDGGAYVPPEILLGGMSAQPTAAAFNDCSAAEIENLTHRQRDVLNGLAQGLSNREIARDLGLSEATVKVHVNHILRALGLKNRSQAAIAANRLAPYVSA